MVKKKIHIFYFGIFLRKGNFGIECWIVDAISHEGGKAKNGLSIILIILIFDWCLRK